MLVRWKHWQAKLTSKTQNWPLIGGAKTQTKTSPQKRGFTFLLLGGRLGTVQTVHCETLAQRWLQAGRRAHTHRVCARLQKSKSLEAAGTADEQSTSEIFGWA